MSKSKKSKKTPGKASPTSGTSCICEDETYSVDCCDGSLQAQGIGALTGQGISNVTNISTVRIL